MELFTFEPLLKQTIWGGDRIARLKGMRHAPMNLGESWELSGVEGYETVVAEGEYKGMSLNHLVSTLKNRLVGKANYERFSGTFPLLIKLIDARQNLSVQVHPNDETAHLHGKPYGKTEMWYVLPSDPSAMLYNGMKTSLYRGQFVEMMRQGDVMDSLARYKVSEGDVFFIPAGRVHAIGAGCFVAEIQQTSDVTYRIYDYNRRDKDGNLRALHIAEAAESIDYSVLDDYRTHYPHQQNTAVTLVQCQYFTTKVYDINTSVTLDYSKLDSFVVLMGVGGRGEISVDGQVMCIETGKTVLLPAYASRVNVSGFLKMLEIFIDQ